MGIEAEMDNATATLRRGLSCGGADCPDLDREVVCCTPSMEFQFHGWSGLLHGSKAFPWMADNTIILTSIYKN